MYLTREKLKEAFKNRPSILKALKTLGFLKKTVNTVLLSLENNRIRRYSVLNLVGKSIPIEQKKE